METIRISLVSMENRVGEIAQNLQKMTRYVQSLESDVICFPEACLSGYATESPPLLSRDADEVQRLLRLADETGKTIIFGFLERTEGAPRITQAMASPEKVTWYSKAHLGGREREVFRAGDRLAVHQTPAATHGLQLCWESHLPDVSTALRKMGAEILWMPHSMRGNPARRRELWMKYLPARAMDNRVYVCALNSSYEGGGGGMMVLDARGDVMAEDFRGGEGVLSLRLPPLERGCAYPDNRNQIDYFLRRRPELY